MVTDRDAIHIYSSVVILAGTPRIYATSLMGCRHGLGPGLASRRRRSRRDIPIPNALFQMMRDDRRRPRSACRRDNVHLDYSPDPTMSTVHGGNSLLKVVAFFTLRWRAADWEIDSFDEADQIVSIGRKWTIYDELALQLPVVVPLPYGFSINSSFLEVARLSSFSRAAETFPHAARDLVSNPLAGGRSKGKTAGPVRRKGVINGAGQDFPAIRRGCNRGPKNMVTALAEVERVPRGEIVVGANEGTCLHILPEVFAEFKRNYPDVAVNIRRSDYAKILESVIDNSVDFGVVAAGEGCAADGGADSSRRASCHRSAASSDCRREVGDHRGREHYPLVLPKAGHTRDALDRLFYERKLKPQIAMELDSSELLKRFVAADVGIGLIARSNVEEDVKANALTALRLADAQIRRDLALVFRKDKALSRAARAFIEIAVKEKVSEFPSPRKRR